MKIAKSGMGLVLGLLLTIAVPVTAGIFYYEPDPSDMYDLDHQYCYTWCIDVTELHGYQIVEVNLVIKDITNWNNDRNILYIHAIDDAPEGVQWLYDGDKDGVDGFDGQGVLVAEYSDTNGRYSRETLEYSFMDLGLIGSVQDYSSDGTLVIAFDPDCHFWNNGIELIITAERESASRNTSWGEIKKAFR